MTRYGFSMLKCSIVFWGALSLSACSDGGGSSSDSGSDSGSDANDTTAPQVGTITPDEGSDGVERSASLTVEFNEDMLGTSIDNDSVELTADGTTIPTQLDFDGASNTLTVTPEQDLALLTEHTLTLDDSIADLAGNTLADEFSTSFTVRDGEWAEMAERIDSEQTSAASPQIAKDGEGNAIAVWHQVDTSFSPNRRRIYSSRYTPEENWSDPRIIDGGSGSVVSPNPQVAFDEDGNAIAVWREGDGDGQNIRANRYTPEKAWDTPVSISQTEPQTVDNHRIAVDSDGNALALWRRTDDGGLTYFIRASRFTAGGTWGEPESIGQEGIGGDESAPQVAFDDAGNAIAIWLKVDGRSSSNSVFFNRYIKENGWEEAAAIRDGNVEAASDLQLAFGGDGDARAVWEEGDSAQSDIKVSRYSQQSQTWEDTRAIDRDNEGAASAPQIAFNDDGDGFAVWLQSDGTRLNIFANRFTAGGDWGMAELIESDNEGSANGPQIAIDDYGNAIAVWSHPNATGRTSMRANRYIMQNGNWGEAEVIDSEPGNSSVPQVIVNDDGTGTAVWRQASDSQQNIRANRFE